MILTDYLFILVVAISALFGFSRGFIRECFTLLNLLIAAFATYFTYRYSYDFFSGQIKNETAIQALSIVIPFILYWILIIIVNSFAIETLGGKGNIVDRLAGTAIGLLRGGLIIAVVYLNVMFVAGAQEDPEKMPDWIKNAKTLNLVKMSGDITLGFMPRQLANCYKFVDACNSEEIKDKLIRNSVYSDSERKLQKMGLTEQDITTLNKIYHDLPADFGTRISNDEIAKLDDPDLIREYGEALVSDYKKALRAKEIIPSVSQDELDSLRNSLDNIHKPKNFGEPGTK